ncbi:MAG: NEAT domain-containing protein [Clostridiales bacterium]|nr:NEAT domain-containing protein [Clostridiales bacterium]
MNIKKRWSFAVCSLILTVTLMIPGVVSVNSFAVDKEVVHDGTLDADFKVEPNKELNDGVYSLPVTMWNMYQDKVSMGQPAINGNMLVKKENGKYEYYLRMRGLFFMNLFGHLWDINAIRVGDDGSFTVNPSISSSIHKTFIDKDLEKKEREFPEVIKFTSDAPMRIIPVQLQVDAMDAIASGGASGYDRIVKGSGKQPAKIIMGWKDPKLATAQEMSEYDVLPVDKKVEGKADKTMLSEAISIANEWQNVVVTNTDSRNVNKGVKWTTAEAKEELANTISHAKEVFLQDLGEDQQDIVNDAINDLANAVNVYKTKILEGTGEAEAPKDITDIEKSNENSTALDYRNLKDGVYSLKAEMWKANRAEHSMANNALDKNVKLTVRGGKYYIQARIKGVNMLKKHGYMRSMEYYDTGYTKDANNFPGGKTIPVKVVSYHMDANGNRLSDEYGTDYPEYIEFPLIKEVLEDSYVPLRVFVPVMEQIGVDGGNPGMGTQKCYMKLDWTSIKAMDESWTPEKEKDVPLDSTRSKLLGRTDGLKRRGLKKGPKTGDAYDLAGWVATAMLMSIAVYTLQGRHKREIKV